jgi:hypothetical protein
VQQRQPFPGKTSAADRRCAPARNSERQKLWLKGPRLQPGKPRASSSSWPPVHRHRRLANGFRQSSTPWHRQEETNSSHALIRSAYPRAVPNEWSGGQPARRQSPGGGCFQ